MKKDIIDYITRHYFSDEIYDLGTIQHLHAKFKECNGKQILEAIREAEKYFIDNGLIKMNIVYDLVDTFSLEGLEDQMAYRYLESKNYGLTLKEANYYIELAKREKGSGKNVNE